MRGILLPQLFLEFAHNIIYLIFAGINARISDASLGLGNIPPMKHSYVHRLTNS